MGQGVHIFQDANRKHSKDVEVFDSKIDHMQGCWSKYETHFTEMEDLGSAFKAFDAKTVKHSEVLQEAYARVTMLTEVLRNSVDKHANELGSIQARLDQVHGCFNEHDTHDIA